MNNAEIGITRGEYFAQQEARFEAAQKLQTEIASFLSLNQTERGGKLGEILTIIGDSDVNIESLRFVTDAENNKKLEAVIAQAVQTGYVQADGTVVKPFEGPHAAVVLDDEYKIHSAASEPYGRVHLAYNNPEKAQFLANLIPYALKKAVIEAHLEKSDRKGGLNTDENWNYIQSLLPADMMLFLGSAVAKTEDKVKYIIGISGAEQDVEFLRGLGDEKFDPTDVNYDAGAGDERFAERVGTLLLNPEADKQIPEPAEYGQIRQHLMPDLSRSRRN
jgi:hypothetical protein